MPLFILSGLRYLCLIGEGATLKECRYLSKSRNAVWRLFPEKARRAWLKPEFFVSHLENSLTIHIPYSLELTLYPHAEHKELVRNLPKHIWSKKRLILE